MLSVIIVIAVLHNTIQQDKEEIRINSGAYNNAIELMRNVDNVNKNVTDVRHEIF